MDVLSEGPETIDLARRPDFRLGQLLFVPSACCVVTAGQERRIQRRVMEVMVTLADMANRTVARDALIRRCWGQRVVGDDAVNRIIAKVRDLARGLEPAPFVLETIPKVGFRLVTFDAIPQSPPAPPAAPPAAPPLSREPGPWVARRHPGRVVVAALLGMLIVGAVCAGVWRFAAPRSAEPAHAATVRIEVAGFEPLQPDPVLRRFSIATSEALVRMLTGIGVDASQHVPPRAAAGPDQSAALSVAGSIDRDKDKYVIDARIEDRVSGRRLWSGRFDRRIGVATDFPEQAANEIADIVNCALQRRAASHGELTPAEFGLVLSYCHARAEDPIQMLEISRRLVAAAPRLSIAHSMAAGAAAWNAAESLSPLDARALRLAARASAERALQLDPRNADAFFALAFSHGEGADWYERERDLQRAAELAPEQSPARNIRVRLLREVGRLDEALDLGKAAIAANPFRSPQLYQMAVMQAARGEDAEAQPLINRLDLIDPASASNLRWTIAFWWGDPGAARATLKAQAPAADRACFDPYLARLAMARGASLHGLPPACAGVGVDWRIRMLAREGDLDGAYAQLVKPVPLPEHSTIFLFYPEMKALRRDPRFMAYARRVGLVDYWTRSGHWPDFCSDSELPYDCRAAGPAA